eukprot:gene260-313_t
MDGRPATGPAINQIRLVPFSSRSGIPMTGTHVIIIFVTVVTLLALYVFGTYRELVALLDRCKKAFGQFKEAEQQLAAAQNASSPSAEIASLESPQVADLGGGRAARAS